MRHKHHLLLPEVGGQGQKRLAAAKVVVIGAGGLGCPILQYLAAAGIGTLTIIDGDVVELSNLQRQTLYQETDIGRLKAEVAAERLRALNSEITVHALPRMFTAEDQEVLEGADLVVEGIDRLRGRHAINRACLRASVPLLSSAASQFEGQVALFRPGATGQPCYACLVPEDAAEDGVCDRDGVLGPVVGVVGSLAATEALKFLLGVEPSLESALLIADLRAGTVRRVSLPPDPDCQICRP